MQVEKVKIPFSKSFYLWFQVGWYSDSSGLHIDLEEDGSFQDYDGENEVGVTTPAFPLTEKPRLD